MKKVLFIDRDGTIIVEPPIDFQVDSLEKLEFIPKAITVLSRIAKEFDYELVMVTNQDGLGTSSFPEETFWPAQNKMLRTLEGEGVVFSNILIDRSFPKDNAPTRKPRTGMLTKYMNNGDYDLSSSFVIGDRITDIELAVNLGSKAIYFSTKEDPRAVTCSDDWDAIFNFICSMNQRVGAVNRKTNETNINVEINLDGTGKSDISTGLGFFDHMLDQLARHSGSDIRIRVDGDLHVDEHHTIEDTAIALGEAFACALGDKRGIDRYGFMLPMDDALSQVALDFSGRNWLEWDVKFSREKIGDVPTEMFRHFFKSFSDAARCNLNIKAEGENEHHKIESIFKGLARSIKMAVRRDIRSNSIPSTKGTL